jgi:YQGE family putative transporter
MSGEEKLLLRFMGLFAFTTGLSHIFLNVYMFRLGGFRAVVELGLISLIFLFIFYILSGYMLKKFSQIALIRIGVLFLGLFYLLVFILKEQSINYILVLGAISGIGNGNFWAGFNLSQYIATHSKSRNEYFGKQNSLISSSNTLAPLIAGAVIFIFGSTLGIRFGYLFLFLIVSLLFFYLLLYVRGSTKHSGTSFSVMHILKHVRTKNWKIILSQQFLLGLYDTSFNVFSAILIFNILKQELTLGIVNSASTIVYASSSLLAIKLLDKNRQRYLIGSILGALGLFIFGIQQNLLGILSLIFIYYLVFPLLFIPASKMVYDVVDEVELDWRMKYHFLVERDSAIGAGRIITYLILLFFFNQNNDPSVAKTWMMIIPIFPLAIGFLQYLYYKKGVT